MSEPREQLRREASLEEYEAIRDVWKKHSIAEDRRDLDGLAATLTDECRYELPQLDCLWEGQAGARQFYRELLGAFPDVQFDLQNIVIGPQGVFEEARMSGTWTGEWLGHAPTGESFEIGVLILFPWDPEQRLFEGERIYLDRPETLGPLDADV